MMRHSERWVYAPAQILSKAATLDDAELTPTEAMRTAAQRGLDLRQKAPKSGKGGLDTKQAGAQGIGSGVARARDILSGKALSEKVVRQMHAFFSRHAAFKHKHKEEPEGKAIQSWLLWGGDAGEAWSKRKVDEMNRLRDSETIEKAARSVKYKHKKFGGYDSKGRKRWIYYYDDPKKNKGAAQSELHILKGRMSVGDSFSYEGGRIEIVGIEGNRVQYKDADGKLHKMDGELLQRHLVEEHRVSIETAIVDGYKQRKAVLDAANDRGSEKQKARAKASLDEWLDSYGMSDSEMQEAIREREGGSEAEAEAVSEVKEETARPVQAAPKEEKKPKKAKKGAPLSEAEGLEMVGGLIASQQFGLVAQIGEHRAANGSFPSKEQIDKWRSEGEKLEKKAKAALEKKLKSQMAKEAAEGRKLAKKAAREEAAARVLVESVKQGASVEAAINATAKVEDAYRLRQSEEEINAVAQQAIKEAQEKPKPETPVKFSSKHQAVRERQFVPVGKAVAKQGDAWKKGSHKDFTDALNKQAAAFGPHHAEAALYVSHYVKDLGSPTDWLIAANSFIPSAELFKGTPKSEALLDMSAWARSVANAAALGYEPLPLAHVVEQRKKEAQIRKSMTAENAKEILESVGFDTGELKDADFAQDMAFVMEAAKGIGARHRMLEAGEGGGEKGMPQLKLRVEKTASGQLGEGASAMYDAIEKAITLTDGRRGSEAFAHELWHAVDFGFSSSHGEYGITASENLLLSNLDKSIATLRKMGEEVSESDVEHLRSKLGIRREASFPEKEEIRSFLDSVRSDASNAINSVADSLDLKGMDAAAVQDYKDYLSMTPEIFARFGEQWTSYKIAEAQAQGKIASDVFIAKPYAALISDPANSYLPHDVFMKHKDKFEQTAFFKTLQGTLSKGLSWRVDVSKLRRGDN